MKIQIHYTQKIGKITQDSLGDSLAIVSAEPEIRNLDRGRLHLCLPANPATDSVGREISKATPYEIDTGATRRLTSGGASLALERHGLSLLKFLNPKTSTSSPC